MKILKRLCKENWFIEAQNGDRLDLKRGVEYTTSAAVVDSEVTVYSTFWVKAPISIFADQESVRPFMLGMEDSAVIEWGK